MAAWRFEALGTSWQIDTASELPEDVMRRIDRRITAFDRAWSRFRTDSLVAAIAGGAGEWDLPDEAEGLFAFYDELNDATGGAVNPLIGRTLADLGYDADYSLRPAADPAEVPPWSSLEFRRGRLVTIEPVLIDVGAAGKGLIVDLVSAILSERTRAFTVDASGDIYHGGTAPIRVAMEHPRDPTMAIGIVELDPHEALCASATNRRAWGDGLHHVLDGRTGRPVGDVVATWVVAGTCMGADGLATAHFMADAATLMARFQHEYARMYADGRVEWSAGFPGEVFA